MENSDKQLKVCCLYKNSSETELFLQSSIEKKSIQHYLIVISKSEKKPYRSISSSSKTHIHMNIVIPSKISSRWKKTVFRSILDEIVNKIPQTQDDLNIYIDFSNIKITSNLIDFLEFSIEKKFHQLDIIFSSYSIFLESNLNERIIKKLIPRYPYLCFIPSKIIPNFYYSQNREAKFPSSFREMYQPILLLIEELERNSLELSHLNKNLFISETQRNIMESSLASYLAYEEEGVSQKTTPADFISILEHHKLKKRFDQKSQLLYTIIHDIKSPLAAIQGFAELLRDGLIGPVTPEIVKNLEVIVSNSKRVTRMVESILEFERYDHKSEYVTQRERFELIELFQDAKMSVLPQMIQKGQVVEIFVPEDLEIVANKELLLRVLQNVLDNAVKYSPQEKGKINLMAEEGVIKGKPIVKILVRDNGFGFAKKDLNRVFKPFTKFEIGSDSTGLGLSIAKKIIEDIHDGTIEIHSPGRNKGTTVEIILPKV